jgi:hypothetical protein
MATVVTIQADTIIVGLNNAFTLVKVFFAINDPADPTNSTHGSLEVQFNTQDYSLADVKRLAVDRAYDLLEAVVAERSLDNS